MNIINLLKYQLGKDLNEQASVLLNENKGSIEKATDAIFPSLMAVFAKNAQSNDLINVIQNAFREKGMDGSVLNYTSNLFTGSKETNELMSQGANMLNQFIGAKQYDFINAVADYANIKSGSALSLVKMSMPLLVSTIGNQFTNQNLDATALRSLLSSQKGHIGAALPNGFSGHQILNEVNIAPAKPVQPIKKEEKVLVSTINKPVKEPVKTINNSYNVSPPPQPVSPPPPPPRVVEPTIQAPKKSSNISKWLPLIIGGIIGLLVLIFTIRACSNTKAVVENKEQKSKELVENEKTKANTSEVKENTTSNPPVTPQYRGNFKSDVEALLTSKSSGANLAIADLKFKSGTAIISSSSRYIIKDLADAMKAQPAANIIVNAPTFSQAVSVKKGLMDAGINRDRIQTKGNSNNLNIELQ